MPLGPDKERVVISVNKDLNRKIANHCKEAGITKSAYLSLLAARDLETTDVYLRELRKEIQGVIDRLDAE